MLVGAQIINAIQSVVSRNVDPVKSAVVSITMFQAGNAENVIPQTVRLRGTARTLDEGVRVLVEERLHRIVESTAAAYGAKAKLTYRRNYPVLVNHDEQTGFAASVAQQVAGDSNVDTEAAADDGRGGFFLHAERAAGRLHLDRQWRQRGLASPLV